MSAAQNEVVIWCLLAALVLMVIAYAWCLASLRNEREQRERLEYWLRKNLTLIRAHCGSASPEVLTVIISLECALPVLAAIDMEALEKRVFILRLEREGRLLRVAQPAKGGGR